MPGVECDEEWGDVERLGKVDQGREGRLTVLFQWLVLSTGTRTRSFLDLRIAQKCFR